MAHAGDARVSIGFGINPAKWWIAALLGAGLIVLALIVFGNLMAATIASTILFGSLLIVGGAFQVMHAFSERGWGGFALSLLIGLLYLATGLVMAINPIAGSLALTIVFAAFLLASGVVRIVLALRFWRMAGWLLLLSGVIGVLAGLVIMTGYPMTGLWVLGLVLGVDLLMHGIWWLAIGLMLRSAHA